MKKKIKITLKSDLHAGTGYSYAGVIDDEVSYTKEGVPFIPGRRIKGCLREIANLIRLDKNNINNIFGVIGNDESGSLRILNAYLKDHEEIIDTIKQVKTESSIKEYITQQNVLEQFTNVRGQTKIDNNTGTAEENTLRFIRVVNHYNKSGKENVFLMNVEIDEEYLNDLEKCVKGLRHIGSNRNRGLGNVKCELIDIDNKEVENSLEDYDAEKEYKINYIIHNDEPLMISGSDASSSLDYIPGQSILGFVASNYKGDKESIEFKDLFLNATTIYSNAYISKKGYRYTPAPLHINRLKKSNKYVDLYHFVSNDVGNQPKSLNNTYINIDNNFIEAYKVEKEVIYHHRKNMYKVNNFEDADTNDELLYSQVAISENQEFSAYIITKGKYVNVIKNILMNNNPTFGKSKNTQYGHTQIESIEIEELNNNKQEFKKGDWISVETISDIILLDDNRYVNNYEDAKKLIFKELFNLEYTDKTRKEYLKRISEATDNNEVTKDIYSDFFRTTLVTGYNRKWNLKKPSFSAIQKGSCFTYKLENDVVFDKSFIGEKNQEGYGEVIIQIIESNDKGKIDLKNQIEQKHLKNNYNYHPIVKDILIDELINNLFEEYKNKKLNINSSKLARVMSMLKESKSKNDYSEIYDDFIERIESIKSDSKNAILDYINSTIGAESFVDDIVQNNEIYKSLEKLYGNDVKYDVEAIRYDYLMMLLINIKYNLEKESEN